MEGGGSYKHVPGGLHSMGLFAESTHSLGGQPLPSAALDFSLFLSEHLNLINALGTTVFPHFFIHSHPLMALTHITGGTSSF